MSFLKKIFGTGTQTKQKKKISARRLRMEHLENRELLSVSVAEFDAIRAKYADLNLSSDMASYNVIEIAANDLSETNLRNAISAALTSTQNDLIVLRTTSARNAITLSGQEIAISRTVSRGDGITIVSLGDANLTINANQKSRVMNVENMTFAMAGLTLTGGLTNGGSNAQTGGGLNCINSNVTVAYSKIYGNTAKATTVAKGGGIFSNKSLSVISCEIAANTCPGSLSQGGGIYAGGRVSIKNTEISSNRASKGGGIYVADDGTTTVFNANISNNTATTWGGGVYSVGNITISASHLRNNDGGGCGGAIYQASPGNYLQRKLIVSDSTIYGNHASNYAGGIYVYDDVAATITKTLIQANTSRHGAGIVCNPPRSTVEIYDSTITQNSATSDGGGIHIMTNSSDSSTVLTVHNTNITFNSAQRGGGIFTYPSARITNSVITNNSAQTRGGAICIHATSKANIDIQNSTLSGNTAGSDGGAISSTGASVTTVVAGCVISGNRAVDYGGGIYIFSGQTQVINSTIVGNWATRGGGIYNKTSSSIVRNSIITGNNYGPDIWTSPAFSVAYSLIGNTSSLAGFVFANSDKGGNILNVDPRFVKFQGSWQSWDLRLAADSPVINKGHSSFIPSGLNTDVRGTGFARIVNGQVDMGAYEFNAGVPGPFVVTPSAESGNVTLSWTTSSLATHYTVERQRADKTWEDIAVNLTTTTYVDKNLTEGVYTYRVTAWHQNESSFGLARAEIEEELGIPEVMLFDDANGDVQLSWETITGAEKYGIWRKKWGGEWEEVDVNVTGTSYVDTGLSEGSYSYAVRALRGAKQSGYELIDITLTPPANPQVALQLTSRGKVQISWESVAGATNYGIWRQKWGGEWEEVVTNLTDTSYMETTFRDPGTYSYAVRAFRGNIGSGFDLQYIEISGFTTPIVEAVLLDSGAVSLTWNTIADATHYGVWRRVDGSQSWVQVHAGTLTDTFIEDSNPLTGKVFYAVRAFNGAEYTDFIEVEVIVPTLTLGAPIVSATSQGNGVVALTWNAVAGADHYGVWRWNTAGYWDTCNANVTETELTDTVSGPGTYTYAVRAFRGAVYSDFVPVTIVITQLESTLTALAFADYDPLDYLVI